MEGGVGEFHSFPEFATALGESGSVSTITGGDGAQYQMLRIPGSYQAQVAPGTMVSSNSSRMATV